jgi:long-subunit acyl-CoA synthetase (AMP-forming)
MGALFAQETQTIGQLWDAVYGRLNPTALLQHLPEQGIALSPKQINATARCLAAYFHYRGWRKGDRIAILAYNEPYYLPLDMAMHLIGAVNVSLSMESSPDFIRKAVSHHRVKALCITQYQYYHQHRDWLNALANTGVEILCQVPDRIEPTSSDKIIVLKAAINYGKVYWREHQPLMKYLETQVQGADPATLVMPHEADGLLATTTYAHRQILDALQQIQKQYPKLDAHHRIYAIEPFSSLHARLATLYYPVLKNIPVFHFLPSSHRTIDQIEEQGATILVPSLASLLSIRQSMLNAFERLYVLRNRYVTAAFQAQIRYNQLQAQSADIPFGLRVRRYFAQRYVLKRFRTELLPTLEQVWMEPHDSLPELAQWFGALQVQLKVAPQLYPNASRASQPVTEDSIAFPA